MCYLIYPHHNKIKSGIITGFFFCSKNFQTRISAWRRKIHYKILLKSSTTLVISVPMPKEKHAKFTRPKKKMYKQHRNMVILYQSHKHHSWYTRGWSSLFQFMTDQAEVLLPILFCGTQVAKQSCRTQSVLISNPYQGE